MTALPTYAATAWYHDRLPGGRPADLEAFLHEVEAFATGDYAQALATGSDLDPARKQAVAARLARYTGQSEPYFLKAELRVTGGMFEHELQGADGVTTGRLDTRFSGPSMDPLSKEADYDPQSAAVSSSYVSAVNDYVRKSLRFEEGRIYNPEIDVSKSWDFSHQPPGSSSPISAITNVMPDLASAMKYNPSLKVMVNGGYYDLATPFYEGWFERPSPANPAAPGRQHRVPVLRVRPHGVRQRALAEGAARQCGRLHRAHQRAGIASHPDPGLLYLDFR